MTRRVIKKLKKSNFSRFLPFLLAVILALALRLLWLDRAPVAISNDELEYVLDAKSIFLTGKDLTGTWSPFSLTPAPPRRAPKAELPSLVISPLIGLMKPSLFSARLPYVIWGVVLLISIFFIAKRLFGDKVALIVVAVGVINPWSFYFSRTAFEAPLALTFYLIAFYLLISRKGSKLLLAFPFLFLAFFSYMGTKIIFLPFLLIVCFYSWFFINKKRFTRQYLVLILLSLCVFGWFLFSLGHQSIKSRTAELLTPFHSTVVQRVDDERRLSTGHPLTFLFSNKAVVFGKVFFEKYLGVFSVDFLFLRGEGRATYSLWTHGMFYYLDLFFLLLGFCFLFVKDRKLWLFLVALAAIAPLPAALSVVGVEYALRGVLLYPLLILFIGLGIWSVISFRKERVYRRLVIAFIVVTYCFQLANFLNIYFFRNPIYNSEGFGFSSRILVNYVNRVKPEARRVLVISKDELGFFKHYLFYSGTFSREKLGLVRELIAKGDYHWENVYFIREPVEKLAIDEGDVVITLPDSALLDKKEYPCWLSIPQLGDGGEIYKIINDPICFKFDLSRYPSGIKFDDFKVENLPQERFCEKYITDLTGYVEFKRKKSI